MPAPVRILTQDSTAQYASLKTERMESAIPKSWLPKALGMAYALRSGMSMQMGPCQVISIGRLVGQSATCLQGPSSRGCCPLERPAQRAAPLSARPARSGVQQGLVRLASNPARQHAQLLLLLGIPAARHLRLAQGLHCLPAARHLQHLRHRPLRCRSLQDMPIEMHLSMPQSHQTMTSGLGVGRRQCLSRQQTAVPSQPAIRMQAAPSVSSKALYTGPSLLAAQSPAPVSCSSPGRRL